MASNDQTLYTRDQKLAAAVYERVEQVKKTHPDSYRTEYGSMAHKLPVLIRTAGLAQALAFVHARGKDADKELLDDLARVIDWQNGDALANRSRVAPLNEYMRLTQHALAALLWFKRFAQSVLEVESDQDDAAKGVTP